VRSRAVFFILLLVFGTCAVAIPAYYLRARRVSALTPPENTLADGEGPVHRIVVSKSRHTLWLLSDGTVVRLYMVNIGRSKHGDKSREGDRCTPEGRFRIADMQRVKYSPGVGSRWILLDTTATALADYIQHYGSRGVMWIDDFQRKFGPIVTDRDVIEYNRLHPRRKVWRGVGIHGGKYYKSNKGGNDRTMGCVAMADEDITGLFDYLEKTQTGGIGTEVVIMP
jgi:hypothetical protein